MRKLPLLAGAIFSAACGLASAQQAADPQTGAQATNQGGQLTYVGSRAQLSLGYDSEFDLVGEVAGVLYETATDAWLASGWLGNDAGGAQLNYHWLVGGEPNEDPDKLSVQKAFVAFDQNQQHDRKITAGWGMEKQNYFLGAYGAAGISGKRRVSQSVDTTTETRNVIDNGVPYQETWDITTVTSLYERPYDYGIGLRAGHFYEEPLLRVVTGLDFEWGKENSNQLTFMLGAEKFFRNSPHSIAVRGEVYKKSGNYDSEDTDARILLLYTYHFGAPYRPSTTPLPAPEPTLVKSELSLDSNAFFDFDRATLRPASRNSLDEVGSKIKGGQVVGTVKVVGHTCSIGTVPYNQRLSERRAKAVRDYLVQQGCDPNQLIASGRGELDPKYPNDTEASRQKNRRVDIQATSVQQPATVAAAWKTEPVWVERALHNPMDHKRTVDYYRTKKTSTTSELKDRQPLNRDPVARDDAATVPQNSAGQAIGVLANDSDPDGDTLSVDRVTQPGHGSVVNNGSSVTYRPNAGFTGTDTFTYVAKDGRGGFSNTATVTVTVSQGGGQNRPPVARDDSATVDQDSPGQSIAVLSNDSDPDGDTLAVERVTQPSRGSLVNNGGSVTYRPNPGFFGIDSFTYVANDGRGGLSNTATVTVNVRQGGGGQNRPPVAHDDSATVDQDSPGQSIAVLSNDSDPDGDTLAVEQVTQPSHGSVVNNGASITYRPNPGFFGIDSFTYVANDGRGGLSNSATVRITVRQGVGGQNRPPTANDDQAVTNPGKTVKIEVLANDSDPDGDPLKVSAITQPANGTATTNGTTVSYKPNLGFRGTDTFTYTANDGRGGTDVANVTVTVRRY